MQFFNVIGDPNIFEVTASPSEVREWRFSMRGFSFGKKDMITETLVKFFGMIVTKEKWNVGFQEKVITKMCESETSKKRRKLLK